MNATSTPAISELKIIRDPELALKEFVAAPIARHYGISQAEAAARFDLELIFYSVTEYDSINGREGFMLRQPYNEDLVWAVASVQEL